MTALFLLVLLEIHSAAAVTHSLQYFYTGSTGLEQFPTFVAVGVVDGEEIDYYDSVSEKNVVKQTWMEGVRDESGTTERRRGKQQIFQANVAIAMQRFNQTTGVHIFQRMHGCEWDDETGKVKAYDQFGYDGEDFVVLDLETLTWIAPTPQAVITKHKWENDRGLMAQIKNYFTQECPEWLKKYVNYGRRSLMKTVLPSVSLLQKTPSSPVTCHATGFYPNRAELVWRKDGVELHEGVEKGEILTNNDSTFQMSADLDLSLLTFEDWKRYDCVFQLSGVNEDIVTKLDKNAIKTNWGKQSIRSDGGSSDSTGTIIGVVVVMLLLLIVAIGLGIFFLKRRTNGFKRANTFETSSSSAEDREPKKESEKQMMMDNTAGK